MTLPTTVQRVRGMLVSAGPLGMHRSELCHALLDEEQVDAALSVLLIENFIEAWQRGPSWRYVVRR